MRKKNCLRYLPGLIFHFLLHLIAFYYTFLFLVAAAFVVLVEVKGQTLPGHGKSCIEQLDYVWGCPLHPSQGWPLKNPAVRKYRRCSYWSSPDPSLPPKHHPARDRDLPRRGEGSELMASHQLSLPRKGGCFLASLQYLRKLLRQLSGGERPFGL